MKAHRFLFLVLIATVSACGGSGKTSTTTTTTEAARKVLVNVDAEGVGLGGYDPVAYTKFDKPVTGTPEHSAQHAGATFRFSSAEHKAEFDGSKHAPQYGGYCAYAASMGRLSPGNPQIFMMLDGQLLVFTNVDFRDQFNKDLAGNKAKADANWPGLVEQHGK